jgi:hypothetical protein
MFYVPPTNGDTENPTRAYTNGETGVPGSGSTVSAAFFNLVLAELLAILTAAGIAPDSEDDGQVVEAIAALIAAAIAAQDLGTAALRDVGTAAGNVPAVLAETGKLDPAILPTSNVDQLRKAILLNGLRDAMRAGSAARILNAFPDSYATIDYIDAGASSNYTHDAGADTLAATLPSVDIATSGQHIDGGGWTGTASIYDGNTGTSGYTESPVAGDYFGQRFATAKALDRIRIYQDEAGPGDYFESVAVDYSDNAGGAWTEVATFTGLGNFAWEELVIPTGTGAHKDWRVRGITYHTPNNNLWQVAGLQMIEAVVGNTTIVSEGYVLSGDASKAYLGAFSAPGSGVYGDTVNLSLSVDDGATWTDGALEKIGVTETGLDILWAEVTLGTADNTLRYRWEIDNGITTVLHGAVPDADI